MTAKEAKEESQPSVRKPRKRKESKHRSFRLSERKFVKRQVATMGPLSLLRYTFSFFKKHIKVFAWFALLYSIVQYTVSFLFATSIDVSAAREQIQEVLGGNVPAYSLAYGLSNFVASSVQSRSGEAIGVYQNIITIFFVLALIWSIRQLMAERKVSFKQVFYSSQYPFLQFVMMFIIVGITFVPLMVSGFLYNIMISQGLAVSALEQVVWVLVCVLLALLSFHVLVPAIFGLFVVTLSEVSPFSAYASSWKLLEGRRFSTMLKILLGSVVFIMLGAILMMLGSYFLTFASEAIFYLVTFICTILYIIYSYKVYRELL